jgi:gamma-glutamyltranspeptidase/glutathione hydrolase
MTRATRAAIAADSPLTVAAGECIARAGGNGVDIAVACALAASLAETLMCSLGGSAFLMVRIPGRPVELIDGADRVPGSADGEPNRNGEVWDVHLPYGDGITVRAGPASIAVPGMLAALDLAWRRHGSLPWKEVVAPALELARRGFPLSRITAAWLQIAGEPLFFRQRESRACFAPDPANPLRGGDRFHIPDMASTLELIAEQGALAFYQGPIARAIDVSMVAMGGLLRWDDLAAYRAKIRRPLVVRSRGFELALNPPPAVGGVALGSLIGLLALAAGGGDGRPAGGPVGDVSEALRARRHAQAQQALFSVRRTALHQIPMDERQAQALLRPEHLRRELRALGSPHTTHLSVATASGELVAVTLSNGYGAGITIPGTGITCNNSLGEPELNPGGYLAAAPGSRLVSNMAPSLARHADGHTFAFGSPGASRITTSMAQVWERHTAEGMGLEAAIDAPRLHLNTEAKPWRLLCEPGIDTSLLEKQVLIQKFDRPDMYFGGIKLAGLDQNGQLLAHADQRREGCVAMVE